MNNKIAEKYDKLNDRDGLFRLGRTDYLVTKALPKLLFGNARGLRALDFGCGAGLSTRFLKSLGYDVIGVDINQEMLNFAKQHDPLGSYLDVFPDQDLPFESETFDLVTSIFVLFEIPSLKEMVSVFKKVARVLKPNGKFIAVTGSEELYKRKWASLNVGFPENKDPKSGDMCKIELTHVDLTLYDYFWTDKDYTGVAGDGGFKILNKLFPLGEADDGVNWKDETRYPPFVFYEFQKLV